MNTTKPFKFDNFSGNDVNITLLFPYKDDNTQWHTITVGHIAAIAGTIQTEGTPRWVMGDANPKGYSQGKRLISGQLVIETINRSFINEIQELLPEDYTNLVDGDNLGAIEGSANIKHVKSLKFADQLPEFDILISLIKGSDPSVRAQRRITGCQIFAETAGIGLSTLDTQEAYQFLAREITPLTLEQAN